MKIRRIPLRLMSIMLIAVQSTVPVQGKANMKASEGNEESIEEAVQETTLVGWQEFVLV